MFHHAVKIVKQAGFRNTLCRILQIGNKRVKPGGLILRQYHFESKVVFNCSIYKKAKGNLLLALFLLADFSFYGITPFLVSECRCNR